MKKFEIEYEGEKIHYIGAAFYGKKYRVTIDAVSEEAARSFFKKYYPKAKLLTIKEK